VLARVFSTRLGAIAIAVILAAAAAAVVVIYAGNYRDSVQSSKGDVTVLVATRQIDQFTPGNQVVDGAMFRTSTVPADSRVDGAVSSPGALKGLVAKSDIYPGEQLTTNQFERSNTANVAVKLKPNQRAIAFPVDASSGLIGQVQAGDHVDVVASFNVVPVGPNGLPITGGQAIALTKTIVSDALVLAVPAASSSGGVSGSSSQSSPVLTLAIGTADVNHVLFAQEKGDIWFALRPPGSATNVGTSVVDVDAVLRGVPSARSDVLRLTGANR
jgi:pilus assembly protein CpaB